MISSLRILGIFRLKLLIIILLVFANGAYGQAYLIKVFFLYGSKPAHGYEKSEKSEFGGLHGGHVSIGMDSMVISFHHVKSYHIFPHRTNLRGTYERIKMVDFNRDTISQKFITFIIPLDSLQYSNLQHAFTKYLAKTPYDYAFFGMRCAAAAYEMLSFAGIVKHQSRFGIVYSNFYPKLLRRKCFKLSVQNHYAVEHQQGRSTRIWESD